MPDTSVTPDPSQFSQKTIDAFAELADLTRPKCGACRVPHNCCSPEQCEATRAMALYTFGAVLEDAPGAGKLPFLGTEGCVVPPHLRPNCAVHVCGMHLSEPEFSKTYWEVRERAGDLMEQDFPVL